MEYSDFIRTDHREPDRRTIAIDNSALDEGETLEDILLNLLNAVRESASEPEDGAADGAANGKQKFDFEVCLDDTVFHISIVEYKDKTEITPPPLSPRELQIARLIAKGMQNKGIAYQLGLSPCTISTYTKRIYLKLNVNSRVEMVAKVLSEFAVYF